jgi:hypothetical protein
MHQTSSTKGNLDQSESLYTYTIHIIKTWGSHSMKSMADTSEATDRIGVDVFEYHEQHPVGELTKGTIAHDTTTVAERFH